jgi:stage III sporulation protein AB
MIKLMLIIVVFIIVSYIGFIYGESFKKRLEDIKECYKAIMLLNNQIVYTSTPLPEAFEIIAPKLRSPYSDMLVSVATSLCEGNNDNVYQAFVYSYNQNRENIFLKNEDLKVIKDLLNSLGDISSYGQEKIFKLALENLKANIDEAKELSNKNTKLYRYVGICLGAMIAILLI